MAATFTQEVISIKLTPDLFLAQTGTTFHNSPILTKILC